jgi:hypothetical protein
LLFPSKIRDFHIDRDSFDGAAVCVRADACLDSPKEKTSMPKKKQAPEPPALVSLAAVSRQLGVASATIAKSPEAFFPHHRLGGRRYALRRDVAAFLEKCAGGSAPPPST